MRASRESKGGAGGCIATALGAAARGGGDVTGAITAAGMGAGAGAAGGADEQPTKTASGKQQKTWRIWFFQEVVRRLSLLLRPLSDTETAILGREQRASSYQRRTAAVRLIISAANSAYCFLVSNSMTAGPIMGNNHAFGVYSP